MPKHTLLIIEDNVALADVLYQVAVEAGFDAHATSNSARIPFLYDQIKPDVIVLDILMPNVDGFEILSFLHHRNSNARIIILSGAGDYRAMAERMAGGMQLSVVANFSKPFKTKELLLTLESIKTSLPPPNECLSTEAVA